jgi:hypothetical protein
MGNIEKEIIKKIKSQFGEEVDEKGYFKSSNPKDNLLETSNWDEIRNELNGGAGNELTSKFCAVHSSSALCVNNFALFKEKLNDFNWLDCSGFLKATFEKRQPTGLGGTPPHLDFYLENTDTVIGVESKFTEYFTRKLPNHKKNLGKYSDKEKLNYLPEGFNKCIIKHYEQDAEDKHLDIAQLIKHAIGLINNNKKKKKRLKLVYIYWQPCNWENYAECKQHRKEIEDFRNRIGKFIKFIPMAYNDLWNEFEDNEIFRNHILKVKERYCFDL